MPENNWSSLTLTPPYAKEVGTALDAVEKVIGHTVDILNVIKDILEVARLIASAILANPLEAIIKQIIAEIEKLLEGLLEDTRLHAIIIPIQKQHFGLGVEPDPNSLVHPNGRTLASATQLENEGKLSGSTQFYANTNPTELFNFINTSEYAVGGNRGFYKALAESLVDAGDLNRPTYPDNFAVTGGCVLLGTRSLDTLSRFAALLNAFIHLGDRFDPLRGIIPTVHGLKARVIPITTVAEGAIFPGKGRIGVTLNWDLIPSRINFPLYNDEEAIVDEIIVIRSTDPKFRQKFSWGEVFGADVSNDRKQLPVSSSGRTKVLTRIKNDGFTTGYVDLDSSLKVGAIYYYTVALRLKIKGKHLPLNDFSNIVRVQFLRPTLSAGSEPPDWLATPSLVQMFPILEEIVALIRIVLDEITTKSFTGPTILDQLIEIIDAIVKRGEKAVAILRELLDLIRSLFENSVGGLYATTITVGYGGIDAWTTELARRLSNRGDTSRPPFDEPKDLVMGLVIVAGVPVLSGIDVTANVNAELAILEALIELLFGSGKKKSLIPGPTPPVNPFLDAIASLEGAILQAEKIAFTDAMKDSRVSPTTIEEKPKIIFDQNMVPTEKIC